MKKVKDEERSGHAGTLPHGGAKELNSTMIDMMLDLGDYDERDNEWLPPKERIKLEARKKGIIVLRM
jgi:hypothetical protein